MQHPALTRYLMVVLMVLGVAAYFQLGQDVDPPFTFRAMVVQAFWPGATAQQIAEQVTDKIERTLQEVPQADTIRSFTRPGESLIIIELKDSAPPKEVGNSGYQSRKRIADMRSTLPQRVIGPVFNDDFGDVYGSIFARSADGFSDEDLRVFAENIRSQLLRVPDVAKVEVFGAQAEKIFVELSQKRQAQLGLDMNAVLAPLSAQNAVEGPACWTVAARTCKCGWQGPSPALRTSGVFRSASATRPPGWPARCNWATSPRCGAARSTRLPSRCATRAKR